jgi:hypothetical protein
MFKFCLPILLILSIKAASQDSLQNASTDTSKPIPIVNFSKPTNSLFHYDKKKVKLVAYTQAISYTTNFATLYSFWYKDYPKSSFHFFDDNGEYLQVDKVSHVYGAYLGGKMSMQMWKWAGVSKKKYVWIGGMTGLAYMTAIEVMDGFSDHWGFSYGDYIANVTGTAFVIGQELLWDEQRIQIKYGTHLAKYEPQVVDNYLNGIYGKSKLDRLFKDYNAQTYWLSFNIKSFFKKANIPSWLSVAVGYGGQDMYGARWDGILDNNGALAFPEDHFKRYRQWYVAPDIDLTKIKTKSKFLKTALFVLNSFKFPTPSLELSQGSLKWNWIHF